MLGRTRGRGLARATRRRSGDERDGVHAGPDPVAYIQHHLTNWCVGCDPATGQPSNIIDFSAFFLDTFLWGVIIAVALGYLAWRVGSSLDAERPTGLQNLIEAVVEFVNQQVKDVFPTPPPWSGRWP